jgi:hypothetical protein
MGFYAGTPVRYISPLYGFISGETRHGLTDALLKMDATES